MTMKNVILFILFILVNLLMVNGFSQNITSKTVSGKDESEMKSKKAYNNAVQNIKAGKYTQALPFINEVIQLDPSFTNAYLERGKIEFQLKQTAAALSDIIHCLLLNEKSGEAFYEKALIELQENQFEQSFQDFTQAINNDFKEASAYYYRGILRMEKEDFA